MKRLILTLAAALTLGGAIAPAAAGAQPPRDRDGTVVRTTVIHRDDGNWHRGDRGWHRGWNNHRGWHRGWRNRRTCRTIWRHHTRIRTCRSW